MFWEYRSFDQTLGSCFRHCSNQCSQSVIDRLWSWKDPRDVLIDDNNQGLLGRHLQKPIGPRLAVINPIFPADLVFCVVVLRMSTFLHSLFAPGVSPAVQ